MAQLRPIHPDKRLGSNTATVERDPVVLKGAGESYVRNVLQKASRVIRTAFADGYLGQLDELETLGDPFVATAYEQINDANRQVLRLEPTDEQGLQMAFESYVDGSTFIVSSLLGPLTAPASVPATFFGQWALVSQYHRAEPTLPWYVVAVALAWLRCATEMWIQTPANEFLAEEVRSTLAEFARYRNNSSLVEVLDNASSDDLRLSIDHLLRGQQANNAIDRILQETLDWASQRVAPNLPPNSTEELNLLVRSQRKLLEHLAKAAGTIPSGEVYTGLECIGPMRMLARMSSTALVPTDEMHSAALKQLHGEALEKMHRLVRASEAARETNELLAQHREEVWRGNTGMMPATRRNNDTAFSERASTYHASTLEGSLAADRSEDFTGESPLEERESETDQDYGGEHESSDSEVDLADERDQELERAVQERQRLLYMQSTVGLIPASQEVAPLDFDDSQSVYAASNLSAVSKQFSDRAETVWGSAASAYSFSIPLEQAIAARCRESGPSMIPIESTTETTVIEDDNRSGYSPSVLSQFSSKTKRSFRPYQRSSQTRLIPTRRESIVDANDSESVYAASSLGSLSRAPSMRSRPSRHRRYSVQAEKLLPAVEEQGNEIVDERSVPVSNIAEWAAQASTTTGEEDMLLQEGSVATALLEDNATLGQHLAAHRAGEKNLVLALDKAHDELGQAYTSLNAKDQTIAKLQETLHEEKEGHAHDVERLQRELEGAQVVGNELQNAVTTLRANAEETTIFIDQIQGESSHAITELKEQLDDKTREAHVLRRQGEELVRTVEEQTFQLDDLRRQALHANQNSQSVADELEQWRSRVTGLTQEVAQRDAALVDLENTVDSLKQVNMALDTKSKQVENEREQLQAELQEVRHAREEETTTTRHKIHELTNQNRDLSDSLEKALSDVSMLQRTVDTDKEKAQRHSKERDKELLESHEEHRRMEKALEEAQLETNEVQRSFNETHTAILRLGQVVGLRDLPVEASEMASSSLATTTVVDRIREQFEKEKEDTNQALLDTHSSLRELALVTGSTNEPVDDSVTTQELLSRIHHDTGRLTDENQAIQRGLSTLIETTVRVTSIDLIRLAQDKFRSLKAMVNESANEVTSLRQRIELLQEEQDKERHENLRQRAIDQQKISNLQAAREQLQLRLSRISDNETARDADLEQCKQQLIQKHAALEQAISASRIASETSSLQEIEWHQRLQEANDDLQRAEQEMHVCRGHVTELEKALEDRETIVRNLREEHEKQEQVSQRQLQVKEDRMRDLRQEYDQLIVRHRQLEEERTVERVHWEAQVDSFNRQLASDEKIALRLERDRLARIVADLEVRIKEQQEIRSDCDRLVASNDHLRAQLHETQDARAFQDDLIAELRRQVSALEASTPTWADVEEPALVEDDAFGLPSAGLSLPGPLGSQQRIEELGRLLAEREYELLILDGKVSERNAKLTNLAVEIEDAEATLVDLYATVESIRKDHLSPLPAEQFPDQDSLDIDRPKPLSPVPFTPAVTLQEWKTRFPTVKPTFQANRARRWVLGFGDAEMTGLKYDVALHDSLLDPCMRFVYREQLDGLLRQTLAFVTEFGGRSLSRRKERSHMFRGMGNLQGLAVRAKQYRGLGGFRLGTVCEFVVPLTEDISYEGAIMQRYCELVVEMSMAIDMQWRASAAQQIRRLIFTERDLPANDPTAVVVRFLVSPFQSFNRYDLVEAILRHLVAPGLGWTLDVPVDAKVPAWTPPEAILQEFDEITPDIAPTAWIKEHLNMASKLVPGLIHVLPGETVGRMYGDLTYVQIARVDKPSDFDKASVLMIGQRDSWIVVDPLWSESEEELKGDERHLLGVLRAPDGVTHSIDRGFALMTWIREVFVHGLPIDAVKFRGHPDRERCTLEHHLKCLFHS